MPWEVFLEQARIIGEAIGVHNLADDFWEDLFSHRLVEMKDLLAAPTKEWEAK